MGERRGSRGAFQSVGGDTGTDTEVPERLRGYGGTRTLATREFVTATDPNSVIFSKVGLLN